MGTRRRGDGSEGCLRHPAPSAGAAARSHTLVDGFSRFIQVRRVMAERCQSRSQPAPWRGVREIT
jgi:hypothetical protein